MDFLNGLNGGLQSIFGTVGGFAGTIASGIGTVQGGVHAIENSFGGSGSSSLTPVSGITYGPYVGNGLSIDATTLVVLGLAAYFLLR